MTEFQFPASIHFRIEVHRWDFFLDSFPRPATIEAEQPVNVVHSTAISSL
jgi:hypothetical protein